MDFLIYLHIGLTVSMRMEEVKKKKSGEQRNMLRRLIFMGQQFSSFFVNSLIDFLSSSSSYRFFSVLPLVLVAYENKIIEGTGHLFFFHHAFTRNFHFPTWHSMIITLRNNCRPPTACVQPPLNHFLFYRHPRPGLRQNSTKWKTLSISVGF